jgi:hypothetical protein
MPAFRKGADRFLAGKDSLSHLSHTAFMADTAPSAMGDSGSFIKDNVGRNVKRNLSRPVTAMTYDVYSYVLEEPGYLSTQRGGRRFGWTGLYSRQ